MGKKRIAVVGEEQLEKKVYITGMKGGERVKVVEAEPLLEEEPKAKETHPPAGEAGKKAETQKKRGLPRAKARGKNYLAARAKIDPTKFYTLPEAIRKVKETSLGKFDGSLEAHLATIKTGLRGEVSLPYFQGKTKKVAIANEETLEKIKSGKLDFDILLSTPDFMPNLVKYAKVLGPRGLMPNPKAGTIIPDPQKALEKFQKASFSFKTEQAAPLVHTVFGKVSQKEEELEANLKAILSAIGPKNIKKAVIKSTMSPAVKLDLSSFV